MVWQILKGVNDYDILRTIWLEAFVYRDEHSLCIFITNSALLNVLLVFKPATVRLYEHSR